MPEESAGCLWSLLKSIFGIFMGIWSEWKLGAAADEDERFRLWMILLIVLLFSMLAGGWWYYRSQ